VAKVAPAKVRVSAGTLSETFVLTGQTIDRKMVAGTRIWGYSWF